MYIFRLQAVLRLTFQQEKLLNIVKCSYEHKLHYFEGDISINIVFPQKCGNCVCMLSTTHNIGLDFPIAFLLVVYDVQFNSKLPDLTQVHIAIYAEISISIVVDVVVVSPIIKLVVVFVHLVEWVI